MSKVWTVLVVLALLSFTAVAFADSAKDDGYINPGVTNTQRSGSVCDSFAYVTGSPVDWEGIFDFDGPGFWICGGAEHDIDFTVECDIEMYAHETLSGTGAYFHWAGNSPDTQQVILNGSMVANHGMYVCLQGPAGCDMDFLKFVLDGRAGDAAAHEAKYGYVPAKIPVDWDISEDGGSTWTPMDTGSWGGVPEKSYLLNDGDPLSENYKIRITVDPADLQDDGHYELDPVFTARPVL